ncbi:hypothetical protein PAN31117_05264 [Pandoraea anapnoica]|uniref:Uncharacterized protein n=1 Tax=Pandoraea anapnoica TaxID=2508301 RepID=A0A5E5AS44_9BURK|nr:hypothetical protein PIN31009_05467 [Pandoraea iniqua]VVE75837.1 hypothetical protein PAN31117_05264 [Pandoraea anapnoica]
MRTRRLGTWKDRASTLALGGTAVKFMRRMWMKK